MGTKKILVRTNGHKEELNIKEIIKYAKEINLKYLTVYAFSTLNKTKIRS